MNTMHNQNFQMQRAGKMVHNPLGSGVCYPVVNQMRWFWGVHKFGTLQFVR